MKVFKIVKILFKEFINRIKCKHTDKIFLKNLYGDRIIYFNNCRSIWQCKNCGKFFYEKDLYLEK